MEKEITKMDLLIIATLQGTAKYKQSKITILKQVKTQSNTHVEYQWLEFIPIYYLPSSIAFLTARRPSCTASFICVRVCLLGPVGQRD